MVRCLWPAFAWLCSMVEKRGNQKNTSFGSSTAMTAPWSVGSVAWKTEMKHSQLHCYRNLTSRTSHRSFTVGDSDGMAMYNRLHHVSNLLQTFRFLALERKEGPGRHGLIVWRLMSISVAQLALTHLAEMHGEPVFDIEWGTDSTSI